MTTSLLPSNLIRLMLIWIVLQAICTEAGLLALRERRMKVTQKDFRTAKETALYRKKQNFPDGLYI
jgi:26S proteasome regulatory subunit T2